ncbi:MAG TPA: M20/M25/M40 family metallo-hydrolase [Cyclobacteriaceae bacterium]|nr:M20/M25/M40 family metallo-hydrolase [Cyclobacteriaceae bacterium]
MKFTITACILFLVYPVLTFAQKHESIDTAFLSKIKDEGYKRSQLMNTLSMLTDVYGPRLTNSPGFKRAADYAKSTLESYGLQNVQFDYWGEEFGRGWELKKFSLQQLDPSATPLIAYPKAWTPGIKGSVQAEVVYLDAKTDADLARFAGKLKGKIVLLSSPIPVKPGFTPDASRYSDSSLLVMANAGFREPGPGFRAGPPSSAQKLAYAKWELCMKEGVLAVLEGSPASKLADGTILVQSATVPYSPEVPFDKRARVYSPTAPKILPQVVVAAEQYNRMVRQIQAGKNVKLELTLEAEFTPSAQGFNIIGEIPGTDLKDEVVMIGAHFDSWHGGTGATDNAAGSAVMMETMRIIKALGKNPRRTIRIGLWSGEEQGLIGSRSYVKRMLGERLDKTRPYDSIQLKPAGNKFSVYFNMDNGTGKYRGVYLQGNEPARTVFRDWLKPFEKMGAATITIDNTGGTDHLAFDAIGLPGFQFIQDEIGYETRTHHTTMDVFDKTLEGDLKHNAVITAAFAWMAANRDGLFPRK